MKKLVSSVVILGFAAFLSACATPASVDLTKDKADRLEKEQMEQKQRIDKLNEEKQQAEKQKMQEQIDKLKQQ